ncbi:protein of unknown function DUF433 [Halothece sp. PCC 7418]|uniref:DUF433 domain-containing protein n=1 Tax=Halothece sp. (strain PCC 7418) TaxID=65093 RepID=UPI0002A08651|nr:DUF433 domain-containing protein [Halothece sp. PCC 7418]AFZ43376.1 protein of unknown function DUF433 [Halothece sp. PCC 7418]
MTKEYIEKRDGAYFIKGSRVSLDSIVYSFLEGVSPESIVQSFPVLTLEEVYGAITYYLANQTEIDDYLREGELLYEKLREASLKDNQSILEKVRKARQVTR